MAIQKCLTPYLCSGPPRSGVLPQKLRFALHILLLKLTKIAYLDYFLSTPAKLSSARISDERMIWFFGDETRLSLAARFRGGRRKKRSGREQLGSDLSRSPRLSTGDRSGSQFSEGLNPRRKKLYIANESEKKREP